MTRVLANLACPSHAPISSPSAAPSLKSLGERIVKAVQSAFQWLKDCFLRMATSIKNFFSSVPDSSPTLGHVAPPSSPTSPIHPSSPVARPPIPVVQIEPHERLAVPSPQTVLSTIQGSSPKPEPSAPRPRAVTFSDPVVTGALSPLPTLSTISSVPSLPQEPATSVSVSPAPKPVASAVAPSSANPLQIGNMRLGQIARETHALVRISEFTTVKMLESNFTSAMIQIPRSFSFLKEIFEGHVVAEYKAQKYDSAVRQKFLELFSEIQKALAPQFAGKKLEECRPDEKELYLFVTGGIGMESFRIFCPFLLPPGVPVSRQQQKSGYDLFHPDYSGFAMQLAKGNLQLKEGFRIPGTDRLIQKQDLPAGKKKLDITIDADLYQLARRREQVQIMKHFREIIRKADIQLENQSPFVLPPQGLIRFYLRGAIGAGKTTLLKDLFQLDEDTQLFSADAVKKQLGGNLAHHESCMIADELENEFARCKISIKTNVRHRDNEAILKSEEGTTKIVIDIVTDDLTLLKQRVHHRGTRATSDEQIEQSFAEARDNRLALIEGALKDPHLTWILMRNPQQAGGGVPRQPAQVIAKIEKQKLTILQPFLLEEMNDKALKAALKKETSVAAEA